MIVLALCVGCAAGLAWSSAQAAVPSSPLELAAEPKREACAPVALVLVASDTSPVSSTIDRISGGGGFSHCYLDVGHRRPDGSSLIVDYQPGAGVHFAPDAAYKDRGRARVILGGVLGAEVWGCVRARLGDPFDAAGALLGRTTLSTCSGLIFGCLPLPLRRTLGAAGRPVMPNDLARVFSAKLGATVRYEGVLSCQSCP